MTTQTTINWDDAPITATHFDPYDDADSKWMKLLDGQWYYWYPSGDGNDNWSIAHLAPHCSDQFIARPNHRWLHDARVSVDLACGKDCTSHHVFNPLLKNGEVIPEGATHFDPKGRLARFYRQNVRWEYWSNRDRCWCESRNHKPGYGRNPHWHEDNLKPIFVTRMSPVYEAYELWKNFRGPVQPFLQALYERGRLVSGDKQ